MEKGGQGLGKIFYKKKKKKLYTTTFSNLYYLKFMQSKTYCKVFRFVPCGPIPSTSDYAWHFRALGLVGHHPAPCSKGNPATCTILFWGAQTVWRAVPLHLFSQSKLGRGSSDSDMKYHVFSFSSSWEKGEEEFFPRSLCGFWLSLGSASPMSVFYVVRESCKQPSKSQSLLSPKGSSKCRSERWGALFF